MILPLLSKTSSSIFLFRPFGDTRCLDEGTRTLAWVLISSKWYQYMYCNNVILESLWNYRYCNYNYTFYKEEIYYMKCIETFCNNTWTTFAGLLKTYYQRIYLHISCTSALPSVVFYLLPGHAASPSPERRTRQTSCESSGMLLQQKTTQFVRH